MHLFSGIIKRSCESLMILKNTLSSVCSTKFLIFNLKKFKILFDRVFNLSIYYIGNFLKENFFLHFVRNFLIEKCFIYLKIPRINCRPPLRDLTIEYIGKKKGVVFVYLFRKSFYYESN